MRLSTSTNIYFNRPDGTKAPITDSIRFCAEAGYKVMDMNFHDCTTFATDFRTSNWENWLAEIKEATQQNNIGFSQAHAPFYNFCDEQTPDKPYMDELIKRSILCSEQLGVKWLVIHAGTDFSSASMIKDSKRKNIAYFEPLLDFAAQHNVGIAIENLWDLTIAPLRRYTANAEELMDLLDGLPYSNVGACWDFEHAAIMRQDQEKALMLIGDKLKATHVSDHADQNFDHILPFSGITDWHSIMRLLQKLDYKGDFTYEIHRYTEQLPIELVPAALKYSVEVGQYLLSLAQKTTGRERE